MVQKPIQYHYMVRCLADYIAGPEQEAKAEYTYVDQELSICAVDKFWHNKEVCVVFISYLVIRIHCILELESETKTQIVNSSETPIKQVGQ